MNLGVATREDIAHLLVEAGKTDRAARDSLARLAQAGATLYVGEQLERIADLMADGYKVVRAGDSYGDDNLYIEPIGGAT